MDQMDSDFDFEAAAWHQVQQEERQRQEEQMLMNDPGYWEFLENYAKHEVN